MLDLLAQKRKIANLVKKEKRKAIGLAEEKRRGRARSQEAREKASIHYVSVWTLFSLHGHKARSLRRSQKINLKVYSLWR